MCSTALCRAVRRGALRCGALCCSALRRNAADGRYFGDRPWLSNLNDPPDTHRREDMCVKEKDQAAESETELVRTHNFVNYITLKSAMSHIRRPHAQNEKAQLSIEQQRNPKPQLYPTSSMRSGSSAPTQHEQCPKVISLGRCSMILGYP